MVGRTSWQLLQSFWVGGLTATHFVLLPLLEQSGLAGLLVDELAARLRPVMVALAGFCAFLQLLTLLSVQGLRSTLADLRGQLLVAVMGLAAGFGAATTLWPSLYGQLFCFIAQIFCGVMLVLQPLPGELRARS